MKSFIAEPTDKSMRISSQFVVSDIFFKFITSIPCTAVYSDFSSKSTSFVISKANQLIVAISLNLIRPQWSAYQLVNKFVKFLSITKVVPGKKLSEYSSSKSALQNIDMEALFMVTEEQQNKISWKGFEQHEKMMINN